MGPAIQLFTACLAFWLVLSGHFGPGEIALGVLASAFVAAAYRDLEVVSSILRVGRRLPAYFAWLFREIVLANLQVARLVLDPRLPVDPVLVRVRAPFADPLALTTLGNSITLTPGTVTLDVEGTELVVHALTAEAGADLVEGRMVRRVARVFGQAGS